LFKGYCSDTHTHRHPQTQRERERERDRHTRERLHYLIPESLKWSIVTRLVPCSLVGAPSVPNFTTRSLCTYDFYVVPWVNRGTDVRFCSPHADIAYAASPWIRG